jgi:RimJ/RimL family protein N-acetyltransferase
MKGERLCLAPVRNKDLPQLWKWINDRDQVLFNAAYRPVAESQHRTWFEAVAKRSDMVLFGIALKTGKLIGTCQLHSISPVHRSAELQIRIGEVHQRGRGYGTEAVQLLLRFGFEDLNLNRIYLHVFSDNVAALRTYEKCGFSQEGMLRQAAHIDGKYVDVTVMGVLRHDFKR